MTWTPLLRICAAALALSTMSFAAGVAGDLSRPPPVSGVSVVVRIPPEIASDAPRAGPLPPLPRTSAAAAAQPRNMHVARPVVAEAPVIQNETLALMLGEHESGHSPPGVTLVAFKGEPRKFG